jgi:hypothetical protein
MNQTFLEQAQDVVDFAQRKLARPLSLDDVQISFTHIGKATVAVVALAGYEGVSTRSLETALSSLLFALCKADDPQAPQDDVGKTSLSRRKEVKS